jgi:hypothetical protein
MLLAYLRGLLKPTYDQGTRSVLRENIILDALSMELDAHALERRTQLYSAYVSLMNPAAAKELMVKQQTTLQNLRYLSEFDGKFTDIQEDTSEAEKSDIVALYYALEEAGLVGENAMEIPPPKEYDD